MSEDGSAPRLRIGRYAAEEPLGAGAFATVWLARDDVLETKVAIKVLADNWARNDGVRRRFVEEAKILRKIDHDCIIRVHEINELEDGRPYIVMALADHGTLEERLARHPDGLPPGQAIEMTIEICEALEVVHQYGVVHRDMKPSNVLFRSVRPHERAAAQRAGQVLGDFAVVLGDFGLAKDLAVDAGVTVAAGTPAYMAPEQARADAIVDQRTDVFAVGVILYEMLSGAPPFSTEDLAARGAHRGWDPILSITSRVPGVDPAVDRVLARALAASPDERYPTVTDLITDLTSLFDGLPSDRLVRAVEAPISTGAAGRVFDLVTMAREIISTAPGMAEIAVAEERLARPLTVAVVGSAERVGLAPGRHERMDVVAFEVDDPAVAASDVIVVAVAPEHVPPMAAGLSAILRDAVSGPVAVEILVVAGRDDSPGEVLSRLRRDPAVFRLHPDIGIASAQSVATVERLCAELSGPRVALVRGSAGLAHLLRSAEHASTTEGRARILRGVDIVTSEIPAVAEIDVLRDLTVGAIHLPAMVRLDVVNLLRYEDPALKVGLSPGTDRTTVLERALALSQNWLVLENTGRIPFSARGNILIAERALDQLIADLGERP